MAPATASKQVTEPFPISCVAGRYLLFDVDVVSHVRRNHNICGVLIGTIPNLSQQNVFLGLPLELMPEEARVLCEKGHAYIVDDVETHRQGFQEMSREDRLKYLAEMDRQGVEAASESLAAQEKKKDVALKKKGLRKEALDGERAGSVMNSGAASVADTVVSENTTTSTCVADSTSIDKTVHVELPGSISSGLGFIMKGSDFFDSIGATVTVPSDIGSSYVDLGSIMKGSSFSDSVLVDSKSRGSSGSTVEATASSPPVSIVSDSSSSFFDLGSILKGSSFLNPVPLAVLSEAPEADLQETMSQGTRLPDVGSLVEQAEVAQPEPEHHENHEALDETSLFNSPAVAPVPAVKSTSSKSAFAQRQFITPTTSIPPLPTPPLEKARPLPIVPKSYPLFRFLHSRGYFFMPGLRFGCNYSVYPGDPLRYHSHFLATGLGWDEKFDLLDIVGGGRLGTGTKKAYMVGGEDPAAAKGDGLLSQAKEPVRAFSVEWASM